MVESNVNVGGGHFEHLLYEPNSKTLTHGVRAVLDAIT